MRSIPPLLLLLFFVSLSSTANAYQFPIDNPFAATVVGTPPELEAELPDEIRRDDLRITIFPKRPTPEFVPRNQLFYSLAFQKQPAPLVFVIAGTGSSHRSAKMQVLEKAFFQAGFHVVSLPSPTYANFIITASESQVPGHIVQDSADLYRVMERVREHISKRIEITSFYVTGYSLGGAQAAFVTKLDEERQVFNFKKALMINPPVSLFNSVDILDRMLEDNIPGGLDNFNAFFDDLMRQFTAIYTTRDRVDFNDEFLYNIYQERKEKIDNRKVAAVIGMSFRISSANMIFSSDVATNSGYILPKNHVLRRTESTTDYFKVAARVAFTDYFHELFFPYFRAQDNGLSESDLKQATSLTSITDYLRGNQKIVVMHNEDDIILAPGEIDFFRDTFQHRATIYPRGGHCGNIEHRDNIAQMIRHFSE